MAQVFHRSSNVVAKVSIVLLVLALPTVGAAGYFFNQSYTINLNVPLEQPVPFSHKHHVGDDGIDCRFCHSTVEKSAFAGLPSTEVCMSCHSQIWRDSPLLEPVRESFRTRKPIQWERVHDLPDFAYFNHSIHIKKGVGCVSCHGRIDEMPLTMKTKDLTMAWCVDCHRNPAKALRPREKVFDLAWTPGDTSRHEEGQHAESQEEIGRRLVVENHIMTPFQLTNCSTCHR